MSYEALNAPPKPRPRLRPALARSCARLDDLLRQHRDAAKLTDEERAAAIRQIYGRMADAEPRPPARPAPTVPDPAPAPPHHLPPALARSAARFAQALAHPTHPAHLSAAQRQAAIREIYGLPPNGQSSGDDL